MSRHYEMYVTIKGHDASRADAIKDAAGELWEFEFDEFGAEISASGQGSLCGGESSDEFAGRLARAVFDANGGPCEVEVCATYLEELPYDTYSFSKDEPPPDVCPACGHSPATCVCQRDDDQG